MTDLSRIWGNVRLALKHNSPEIASGLAGLSVLGTVYLAAKASFQAAKIIDEENDLKSNAKLVWKLYIPTAIATTSTLALIIGANRLGSNKTIAAQTALAVTQRVYSDYRDEVIKEFGSHKDKSIRDKVATERVKENPPGNNVIIAGSGGVLCCELFTGRYFTSDMETLRRAQNTINDRLLKHDYATLDDLYWIIKLPPTSNSSEIGWKSNKLMEMEFTSVLTDDGRPCLAFEYNYQVTL